MTVARDEDTYEIPPYPEDWDAERRVAMYWFALFHTHLPSNTQGWHTVRKLAEREGKRKANLRGDL